MKRLKKIMTSRFVAALFVGFLVVSPFIGESWLGSTSMESVTLSAPKEAKAASMLGVVNQAASTASMTGPESCSGTNYVTGGSVTQPPAVTGNRRYCYGMYQCDPSKPATCVNPVTGQQMTPGQTCRVGMYETGQGGLSSRALPLNVCDCARQGVCWRFSQPEGGHRMANVGAYIDKNGCYTKYTWNLGSSQASGYGESQLVCPTAVVNGSYVYGLSNSGDAAVLNQNNPTSGGSGNNTGGQGGASGSGNTSGQAGASATATGWVESASDGRLRGWALSVANPSQAVTVRVYHKAQGSAGAVFLGEFNANVARPDLVSTLQIPSGASDRHGFDIQLPASVRNGDTLLVYAVVGAWNPLIGEIIVGSAARQTPASFNGVGSGAASFVAGIGSVARPTEVQIRNPQSWDEWVAGCNALNAQVCLVPVAGGGTQCAATARGLTAAEYQLCQARFEACGAGRSGRITGYCDPGRYTECREAGGDFVDWAGRINTDACDRYLLDNGCAGDNATTCRPECILPGGNRPADCPAGSGGSSGNNCVDETGRPMRCNAPPPQPVGNCVDETGRPMRCDQGTSGQPLPGDPAPPADQIFGPAPRR